MGVGFLGDFLFVVVGFFHVSLFCSILFMVLCRKMNYTPALQQKNKEPTHGLQQLLLNGVPVHWQGHDSLLS